MNKTLLRDSSIPINRIADMIEPYLDVIEKQFKPEHIIIFGSYAYGNPDKDSDLDILAVVESTESPARTARKIRKAWQPLRGTGNVPCIDLIVENPEGHKIRFDNSSGFYDTINAKGLHIL